MSALSRMSVFGCLVVSACSSALVCCNCPILPCFVCNAGHVTSWQCCPVLSCPSICLSPCVSSLSVMLVLFVCESCRCVQVYMSVCLVFLLYLVLSVSLYIYIYVLPVPRFCLICLPIYVFVMSVCQFCVSVYLICSICTIHLFSCCLVCLFCQACPIPSWTVCLVLVVLQCPLTCLFRPRLAVRFSCLSICPFSLSVCSVFPFVLSIC